MHAMFRRLLPLLLCLLLARHPAVAAPTSDDSMPAAVERFTFRSADGIHDLSAACFPAADPKGIVVMVNGRSESWLKHIPLCRELNHAGDTVYSYDHRGQGLSPRLAPGNAQIGHVDWFPAYSRDLGLFLEEVKKRESGGQIALLGNSMGAAVIVDYLPDHPDPAVRKFVLCSPMFRIKTAPWPEPVARLLLAGLHLFGKGAAYAPGEEDASPSEPFEHNRVTSSRKRWQEILLFRKNHPEALTGGASVDWVAQALALTPAIREKARLLGPETLILLAGRDDLVVPWIPSPGRGNPGPVVRMFPEARHEILLERNPIRKEALDCILAFLENPLPPRSGAIPLDRDARNGHTSGTTQTIL